MSRRVEGIGALTADGALGRTLQIAERLDAEGRVEDACRIVSGVLDVLLHRARRASWWTRP